MYTREYGMCEILHLPDLLLSSDFLADLWADCRRTNCINEIKIEFNSKLNEI